MNRTRFALLATLVALFAADTASAAPTWLGAQTVSAPGTSNSAPDVAVNARGDAVAAWLRKSGGAVRAYASTRPAGGAWRTPDTLLGSGVDEAPRVGIDGSGRASVIGASSSGAKHQVWLATTAADGSFPGGFILGPGSITSGPAIAVNEHGDAVAVWRGYDGFLADGLFAAVRTAGKGWSSPKQLSTFLATAENADVAINQDGRAVATWEGDSGSIEAAFYTPGTGWGKADTVEPAVKFGGAYTPHAAIDGSGRATILWTRFTFLQSAVRAAAGSASSGWTQVDIKGSDGREPDVAVAPDGRAVATWKRDDNGHAVIDAALRAGPGVAWSDPTLVSDPKKNSATPSAAIDPQGNALVVWDQDAAVGHLPYASVWRAGGYGWDAQHALAAGGASATTPRVAFDSGGDAVVAFVRGNTIQAARLDAAPVLSGVQSPGSAAPGEPLAFSATATDLWSAVTIGWDFGDGGTGTGSPASHAYAAPGDYTVTVTARDAVGNESSEIRVVHVESPPASSSSPSGPPPQHAFAGLVLKRQRIAVKKGIGRVAAACPVDTVGACAGTLRLLSGKKVVARARFNVKPGRSVRIRVRLRRVPRSLRASASAHDGLGATKVTGAKLKLRRG